MPCRIESGDQLKLLGFYLGRRPRPDTHVREMRRKFAARVVSTHLKARRHSAEVPSPSLLLAGETGPGVSIQRLPLYVPMLSEEARESLERLQRVALKAIYGFEVSCEACLERSSLTRLDTRLEQLFIDFT